MNYYYNITIVNRSDRNAGRTVPVMLDLELDCDDGNNREAVVDLALIKNLITKEDVQHICEVENMSYDEFVDLLEYNKQQYFLMRIKAVQQAHDDNVTASQIRRDADTKYFLDQYAQENAYFGTGDTLKVNKMNSYLKVEGISARTHQVNSRIAIIYRGTFYRKVKGQMRLLKGRTPHEGTISQDNCTLYDAVIDKP